MVKKRCISLREDQDEFVENEAARLSTSFFGALQQIINNARGVKIGDRSNNRRAVDDRRPHAQLKYSASSAPMLHYCTLGNCKYGG